MTWLCPVLEDSRCQDQTSPSSKSAGVKYAMHHCVATTRKIKQFTGNICQLEYPLYQPVHECRMLRRHHTSTYVHQATICTLS